MKVLVTGSTGLIGTALVRDLASRGHEVVAATRKAQPARTLFEGLAGVEVIEWDVVSGPLEYEGAIDAIVHAAAPTASRDFVEKPVEIIKAITGGTANVLETAVARKVSGMVFLSTMEVYGAPSAAEVTEKDYGYLDPVAVRSSYPEAKRLAEALCTAYAAEYSVPVRIARLTQTFGAGVKRDDMRVFAQFGRAAATGSDIVLHTAGRTERCYLSIRDAVSAIGTLLIKGEPGAAYNVANPATYCSIAGMADALAARYPRTSVRFEISADAARAYAPEFKMKLDVSKLESLGWAPTQGLDEMFDEMIAWWESGNG